MVVFCLLAIAPLPLCAQEETKEETPQSLVAPELLEYVQAEYPPEAFAKGQEAEVLAEIQIDENGFVTKVQVIEPVGSGFDEAAVDAIYQFLFKPAQKEGVSIPAKVLYRYTFFISKKETVSNTSAEDEAEEATPLPATLKGKVADMEDNPIASVQLALVKIDGELNLESEQSTIEPFQVDANGEFEIPALEAGLWQVDIVAAGYKPLSVEESLEAGERLELVYHLELEVQEFETVVRGRKPPREVTRREITRREITRIPGTGGDALRSIQNLPGMARAPGFSGELLVRGSAPEDSKYFFDTMPIPMLYHFGGLTSVINSDLLERIDFYPGNYSVRYGSATGGIVDVYPKTPATDRFHGYVDADLWDISALLETPIGENWSIAASGRRSYVDAILNAVMPDNGGFQFTVAPRYYDYQLVADYHPDKKRNLQFFIFGSDDKVVFLFGNQVVGDPTFSGGMNFRTMFHQFQVRYRRQFSSKVSNELNIGTGYWDSSTSFGDQFRFSTTIVPIFTRDEIEWKVTKKFILRSGVDIQTYWAKWDVVTAMNLPVEGENVDPLDNGEPFVTSGKQWAWWPAIYGEFEFLPIENLRLIPGVRLAWFDEVHRFGFDPRLAVRHQLFPNTVVKGGIGLFNQAPQTATTDKNIGNPNLKLIKAMHYSIGVEQQVTEKLNLSIEGFYKQIFDIVVSGVQSDEQVIGSGSDDSPLYTNEGEGSVYGLELLLKHQPTDRFFGWIAYTFMKSTRIDHPGDDPRPFDYDQTHILTIVASMILGRGWEAGLRFRLVSGNPDTPVVGSFYNSDTDTYWPMHGATNSDRLPPFHQLDFRIDKTWEGKYIKQSIYLDIQNIYNRKNPEGYSYNYDFSQRVYFNGMPLFPSIGYKLEY